MLFRSTYGDPDVDDAGWLMVLAADGEVLHDVPLPHPGHNGNGNGAPAAPTVADLDGDGQLEVFVQTFDHGMDIFMAVYYGTGKDMFQLPDLAAAATRILGFNAASG